MFYTRRFWISQEENFGSYNCFEGTTFRGKYSSEEYYAVFRVNG